MNNPISENVFNHLEFLGYKVENHSGNNKTDLLIGKHDNRSNLVIQIASTDTILISAGYQIGNSNRIDLVKLLKLLNSVNYNTILTKWYFEENESSEVSVNIDAYSHGYQKQVFGNILDILEGEIMDNMKDFVELTK